MIWNRKPLRGYDLQSQLFYTPLPTSMSERAVSGETEGKLLKYRLNKIPDDAEVNRLDKLDQV